MANKNESGNKGGERFHKRLKGEQRVRTSKTKEGESGKLSTGAKSGFTRKSFGFNPSGEGGYRKNYENKQESRTGSRSKTPRTSQDSNRPYSESKRVHKRDSEKQLDSFRSKPRTPRDSSREFPAKKRVYKKDSEERGDSLKSKSRGYGDKTAPRNNEYQRTGRPVAKRFSADEDRPSFRRKKTETSEYSGTKSFFGNKREPRGEGRFPKRETANKPAFTKSEREKTEFKPRGYNPEGTRRTSSPRPGSDRYGKDTKARTRKPEQENPPANFKGRGKQLRETSGMLEKGASLANEAVRLNRYIAMSGSYSRREADEFISEGRVSLNGLVVTELGTKVQPGDVVKLDGQKIAAQKPVYILLNKPKGYVTTTEDPEGRQTVMDLIQLPAADNLFPVGRLDRNTTGVLLITNDGDLAQKIMHPSFNIKKIYRVKLDRKPSREHMMDWIAGVDLEDGRMSFEQVGFVEKEEPTVLGVEIHSGRNRVVRRMFEHFGYEVKSLDRVLLGEFDKLNLGRGRWRFLNDKEMRYVMKIKARKNKTSVRK